LERGNEKLGVLIPGNSDDNISGPVQNGAADLFNKLQSRIENDVIKDMKFNVHKTFQFINYNLQINDDYKMIIGITIENDNIFSFRISFLIDSRIKKMNMQKFSKFAKEIGIDISELKFYIHEFSGGSPEERTSFVIAKLIEKLELFNVVFDSYKFENIIKDL
jgi:hypothetical protein